MTTNSLKQPYKRILLKISGEMLMGQQEFGISQPACNQLAKALLALHREKMQIAVVIGGGNIFRGIRLENSGMQRSAADQMGMLATLINGISLQQALHALGVDSKVMTALECPKVAEAYNWEKATESLNKGTLLIFVGGTGNPYFTTDSAAALRACEINADILAKATKVDGIYTKDPLKFADAVKYETITYSQALSDQLEVMDATAIALCRSNRLPIFVFNMQRLLDQPEQGSRLFDRSKGTLVTEN
jgi:uridylate kinase